MGTVQYNDENGNPITVKSVPPFLQMTALGEVKIIELSARVLKREEQRVDTEQLNVVWLWSSNI